MTTVPETHTKAGHRMIKCACGRWMQASSARCQVCARAMFSKPTLLLLDDDVVQQDRQERVEKSALAELKKKYDAALRTIEQMERVTRVSEALGQGLERYTIDPLLPSGTSESTVIALASDWHTEERVTPGQVSGLNEFNLTVARERITRFFQATLRLVQLLQQDTRIDTLVLALLGDFITNDIHEAENAELNQLLPTIALNEVQSHLVSGIEFLIEKFLRGYPDRKIVLPCHSGNHGRTTKTTRFGAENGHSLEYLLYGYLAAYFRHESQVQFIIPEGMHSYLNVYGQVIRFHHGHAVKYGGGVGGLYIPVNKAIAQWDKAIRADLDCFGHFHQLRDGGKFICNGSLIGYNAFALSIKADYEPPRQALFLMDKKRGRTCLWPIIVGANRTIPLPQKAAA